MRHEFPAKVRRAALERAGDRCEAIGPRWGHAPGQRCTAILSQTKVELDHYPLGAHAEGSNTLDNCVVCCSECNQRKANLFDKAIEAKIKRLQKRIDGTRRKRKAIPSRGFQKTDKPRKW